MIYEVANNLIGVSVGLEGAIYRLNLIMRNIENLQKEIEEIENIMKKYLT